MSDSTKPQKPTKRSAKKSGKAAMEIPEKFRHIDIDAPHPLLDLLPDDTGWVNVLERQEAATPEQNAEAEFVSRMRFLRAKRERRKASRQVSSLVAQLKKALSLHDTWGLEAEDLGDLATENSQNEADQSMSPFASAPLLVSEDSIIASLLSKASGDYGECCFSDRHSFLRLLRFFELYEDDTMDNFSAGQLRKMMTLMDAFEIGLLSGTDFQNAINTILRKTHLHDVYSALELMQSPMEHPVGCRTEFRALRNDIDRPSEALGRPPISADEKEDFLRFLSSRSGVLWVTWNPKSQHSSGG